MPPFYYSLSPSPDKAEEKRDEEKRLIDADKKKYDREKEKIA